jgi:hypothetical protein
MKHAEAKEILQFYRTGTADADDPQFAAALELARRDVVLARWFEEHCAVHEALRARFREIIPPAGLKEQIIAENKIVVIPSWRRPVVLAAAAAIVLLLIAGSLLMKPREPHDFTGYRSAMVSTALRTYGMDLETSDLGEIRAFLAKNNAHADYVLPPELQRAQSTGCVVLTWQGKRVSMICFHSGKPLGPGEKSDLFLFIADRSALPDAPAQTAPALQKVNRLITASWSRDGKTYILAGHGDEEFLQQFL